MLPCTHASKGKLAFNLKRQEVTSPSQPPAQAALTATPPLTYHLSSTLLLATCGESFALLNVSEYEQPAINRGGRSYVRCMVKASPYPPLISLSHIYIILITSTSFFFPLHSPVSLLSGTVAGKAIWLCRSCTRCHVTLAVTSSSAGSMITSEFTALL